MVSWRFMANAILSLVPTPSTLETRTGWRYFRQSNANKPPKPPTFPSTPLRFVRANNSGSVALTLLPRSISTPAWAYAFCFIGRELIRHERVVQLLQNCRNWLQLLAGCNFKFAVGSFC